MSKRPSNKKQILKVERLVLTRLAKLDAYRYHRARATGSTYIKFDERFNVGSLRIADHIGIKKYKYRWNIFLSTSDADAMPLERVQEDRGTWRRYYVYNGQPESLDEFFSDILESAETWVKWGVRDVGTIKLR